jgi:hypothetical protein
VKSIKSKKSRLLWEMSTRSAGLVRSRCDGLFFISYWAIDLLILSHFWLFSCRCFRLQHARGRS